MRFLVDADLPRATADHCRQCGHDAEDVRDVGLGAAEDIVIASHARKHKMCILTGDFGFADIRRYPPEQYSGIVVFDLPPDANRAIILSLISRFFQQDDVVSQLTGRLAIVDSQRIRLRPAAR